VPIVLNSGSLNHLEPYGPVKACNGIAFFLPFYGYFIGASLGDKKWKERQCSIIISVTEAKRISS